MKKIWLVPVIFMAVMLMFLVVGRKYLHAETSYALTLGEHESPTGVLGEQAGFAVARGEHSRFEVSQNGDLITTYNYNYVKGSDDYIKNYRSNFDEYWDDEQVDDYGGTVVYIDLRTQWLTVKEDGVAVFETGVVTGMGTDAAKVTPTGTFSIYAKETNRTLKGKDYEVEVTYWMPFNGNIGMHDASWRDESEFAYGGDTYLYNGSHGCVNMSYWAAETVYSLVSVGDLVVVTS